MVFKSKVLNDDKRGEKKKEKKWQCTIESEATRGATRGRIHGDKSINTWREVFFPRFWVGYDGMGASENIWRVKKLRYGNEWE